MASELVITWEGLACSGSHCACVCMLIVGITLLFERWFLSEEADTTKALLGFGWQLAPLSDWQQQVAADTFL
jgi:hypothetical protein